MNNNSQIAHILIILLILLLIKDTVSFNKHKFKKCKKEEKICNWKKGKVSIPSEIINSYKKLFEHQTCKSFINRKGCAVSKGDVLKFLPDIQKFYFDFGKQISKDYNKTFFPVINDPLSITILSYDREGDHIDFHYDSNIYLGETYTVLVPLTSNKTCSQLEIQISDKKKVQIPLKIGEYFIFKSDSVYHRVTPSCEQDVRHVLSFVYTTNSKTKPFQNVFNALRKLWFY